MRFLKQAALLFLAAALLLCTLSGCGGALKLQAVADPAEDYFRDRPYPLEAGQTAPAKAEHRRAQQWLEQYLLGGAEKGAVPFDFLIDGESFAQSLSSWQCDVQQTGSDDVKTDYTLVYTRPDQPVAATVYASLYRQWPVVEWTVWLENTGGANSGVITEFNGLNLTVDEADAGTEYNLTTFAGSRMNLSAFKPNYQVMEPGKAVSISGAAGKPSAYWAPYYNLQWQEKGAEWNKAGMLFSVGWSGQWSAKLERTDAGVQMEAGQERFASYLEPGEQARGPLMSILFYEQDFMRSQNMFRRFMYETVMPKQNGQPLPNMTAGSTAVETDLTKTATTENQVAAIERWARAGLKPTHWLMDAGWYEMPGGGWEDTGNWDPDPARFGDSMMEISEAAEAAGMGYILWYEPERVNANTDFSERTEYLLTENMFDLSNDEALQFLCEYIVEQIERNGVSVYRQDCNFSSLMENWKKGESENRIGMVENKYVVNYLRFFDYLLEHCPGLLIDSCASGGRRIEMETNRRSVVLWRDDACYEPTLTQCQSYGINFYVPYSGHGTIDTAPETIKYAFRSNMCQSTWLSWVVKDGDDAQNALYRERLDEFYEYGRYLMEDYYPLTRFSDATDVWMAWQYNDPEDTSGIIQVFKRPDSTQQSDTYLLSGLHKNKTYVVTDIDTGAAVEKTGRQLMTEGLTVDISEAFDAKLFHYAVK